jgi:hypothetical protein
VGDAADEGLEAGWLAGDAIGAVLGDVPDGSVMEDWEHATVSPASAANERAPATASTEAFGFIKVVPGKALDR